jgi:hypothetical protein
MTIGGQVRPRALVMNAVLVPLPAPGRTAEQDDLLGEAQFFAADIRFQIRPDRQLGVLDLQILDLVRWGGDHHLRGWRGGRGFHGWGKLGPITARGDTSWADP